VAGRTQSLKPYQLGFNRSAVRDNRMCCGI